MYIIIINIIIYIYLFNLLYCSLSLCQIYYNIMNCNIQSQWNDLLNIFQVIICTQYVHDEKRYFYVLTMIKLLIKNNIVTLKLQTIYLYGVLYNIFKFQINFTSTRPVKIQVPENSTMIIFKYSYSADCSHYYGP